MINLRSNYPSLPEESILFQRFLAQHLQPESLLHQPVPITPDLYVPMLEKYLQVPASLLSHTSNIIDCNSGSQAIFNLLSLFKHTNTSIGVEDFTYSGLKSVANGLYYHLATIDCDAEGLLPGAVAAAIGNGIKLFYVQPTIHNPTCRVMSKQRREEIANIVKGKDALLIEDDAYRFLHPAPPPTFLQLLPEQTIYIASLAKPFNSFIQTCFIIYPKVKLPFSKSEAGNLASFPNLVDMAGVTRSTLFIQFATHLLAGADLFPLMAEKRQHAQQIRSLILPLLSGLQYQTHPSSFHIWIRLPAGMDSHTVVWELAEKKIRVTGSHECSATANTGFIRIALSAEKDMAVLQNAVREVRDLLLEK